MILYASRTGTKRNLSMIRERGWRLLVSATGVWRNEGFPYAIDNGAWTAHQQNRAFDSDKYLGVVDAMGASADWIVIPDRVGDAIGTFEMFDVWWPRIRGAGLLLFALQDGMTTQQVDQVLRPGMGLFVGGSDHFKESTAEAWGRFARSRSLYLHVGRVNTARRIAIAAAAGADSVDGTSASRFCRDIPMLTRAAAQPSLFAPK